MPGASLLRGAGTTGTAGTAGTTRTTETTGTAKTIGTTGTGWAALGLRRALGGRTGTTKSSGAGPCSLGRGLDGAGGATGDVGRGRGAMWAWHGCGALPAPQGGASQWSQPSQLSHRGVAGLPRHPIFAKLMP